MLHINSSKVLLFSDLHWGKGRDNLIKLESMDKYIDWLISEALRNKIKTIIFMGDWFDNRSSISVKTYNHSYLALQKISKAGLTMYLFVGNHDAYFKDSIEVNSLKSLGEIKNIHIVDKMEDVTFSSGSRAGFIPWDAFNYEELKSKSWDAMFGHFEFIGAKFSEKDPMTCEHGSNTQDMVKVAPIIFSGHFHARKEYVYKNGKIITIGCPLELDWGDTGNLKGYFIVDTTDFSYTFTENTISPRHYKLAWSKIQQGSENLKQVNGNYARLVVDIQYNFEDVMKCVNLINSYGPLKPCDTEFLFNGKFDVFGVGSDSEDLSKSAVTRTKLDYIKLFIEKMDDESFVDLSRDKTAALLKRYFESNYGETE